MVAVVSILFVEESMEGTVVVLKTSDIVLVVTGCLDI